MAVSRDSGLPPWQRPPFEPGNTLSLRHGAFSPRQVHPLAAELIERAILPDSYLGSPEWRPAVEAWARAEARALLVDSWLQEHGVLDSKGKPRPAAEYAVRLDRHAAESRARLGLDPLSRARLGRDLTTGPRMDLASSWAQQHEEDDDR